MRRFLKQIVTITLGTIIGGLILCALLVGLILGIPQHALKKNKDKITDHSVLKIKLHGTLVETLDKSLFQVFDNDHPKEISVITLKNSIIEAKSDHRIVGIYLEVGDLTAGWGNLSELRNALTSFKESGKFIIAYGDQYTSKSYYLSSLADEIILNPSGDFNFIGLQLTVLFYKQFLEKLGITPQVFKVGQYKSAVEPFTTNSMSEANKEQYRVLLDHIYTHLVKTVATDRNLSPQAVKAFADKLAITHATKAHQAGFVTQLGYKNHMEEWIKNRIQRPANSICFVDAHRYYNQKTRKGKHLSTKIAILVASGMIVDKEGMGAHYITPIAFSKALRKLREDEDVKAIVLRINSPGGSVVASDTIWNEIMLTKKVKPVVASMSDVAASGGYYLATACDQIVAYPTTITGSIGIYTLFFDIRTLLQDKLGVTGDMVKTSASADFLSMVRPISEDEKKAIQYRLETSYDSFLDKVVAGRKLEKSKVARLAQGRVWPGDLAQENGLIDHLGGLKKAVEQAATLANLQQHAYEVIYAPEQKSPWLKTLFSACNKRVKTLLPMQWLASYKQLERPLQEVIHRQGIQASLDCTIDIE